MKNNINLHKKEYNNETYEGIWNNSLKEGKGIYYYKNGDKNDGEWKN